MDSSDVTVGAELEAAGPDGRWRPARVLRRCGPEGAPAPDDPLFDVLTGGLGGHRRASELRPRRRWPLRLLSPILDLIRLPVKRGEAAEQPTRELLRGAEELVKRALDSLTDGGPGGSRALKARLANILRDIAQANEAAVEVTPDGISPRDPS